MQLGKSVDAAKVLAAKEFLDPPDDEDEPSDYLDQLLPRLREFLARHCDHDLLYVDEDWLFEKWELGYDYRELTANGANP